MHARLVYVIKFVADMDRAVAFHRDTLGLALRIHSPFWSEFSTGDTTLALHPASDKNPAGSCQLGYRTDDLAALYETREAIGLRFTAPPAAQRGALISRFLDSEGAECSLSG
jgi:predicted enzyme related to lactoylglutathione lyase